MRSVVCALAVVFLTSLSFAEIRTWTDNTGKYKTQAEFVSLKNGKVTLKREDGAERVLPLSRLSEVDQGIAKELAEKQAKASRNRNGFINSVRAAPMRTQTINNLKQIALGLINYESATTRFPTKATGRGGKPGLSWRVAILPYIEENNLYKQFRHNEPWDSEHNKKLIEKMPSVFKSPGSSVDDGWTNYLAVMSDDSIIVDKKNGKRMRDVMDGTSRTMMIVEANDTEAVIWTKPDDYEFDVEDPSAGLGGIWPGQFIGAFADGAVQRINLSVGNETIKAMFTRNGAERYSLE
ncbi:MAG: DUF1559 domain-containing protein [Planctomycetales bacterium]|nr:DUF1559 domain-containing protein [Planctomycetales bacterium]